MVGYMFAYGGLGFLIGIVFDIFGFFFLRNLSSAQLDMVLIATPFIFMFMGMLAELPEYAEKNTEKNKDGIYHLIHVWCLVFVIVVEIVLILTQVCKSVPGVVLNGVLTLAVIETLFRPVIIAKWKWSMAVILALLFTPLVAIYFVIIAKSFILVALLVIAAFAIVGQEYSAW